MLYCGDYVSRKHTAPSYLVGFYSFTLTIRGIKRQSLQLTSVYLKYGLDETCSFTCINDYLVVRAQKCVGVRARECIGMPANYKYFLQISVLTLGFTFVTKRMQGLGQVVLLGARQLAPAWCGNDYLARALVTHPRQNQQVRPPSDDFEWMRGGWTIIHERNRFLTRVNLSLGFLSVTGGRNTSILKSLLTQLLQIRKWRGLWAIN